MTVNNDGQHHRDDHINRYGEEEQKVVAQDRKNCESCSSFSKFPKPTPFLSFGLQPPVLWFPLQAPRIPKSIF